MPENPPVAPRPPFESASELREQHAKLLEALDRALEQATGEDAETAALRRIEPPLREFLERAAATGVYLEAVKERTACQALVDYWVSSLARAGVQAPATRLAKFDATQLPDLNDKPCPYVGLEAFRSHDFFFGRDEDTRALIAQLEKAPLLVVLGASGSGKSSLILGGVLPALGAPDARPALRIAPVVVPGNNVLLCLAEAVLQVGGATGANAAAEAGAVLTEPRHLATLLGTQAPATLVVIDQFEEVFTLADAAARDAAAAALAALLESDRGHRVILTMREEFRSRLVQLQALTPYLDRAWYSMRPMGYAELRAAVEQPAAKVNLQFEAGIVDDLVKKVLGQPAALPLLQFTLRELWNRRDRNRITREVYDRVGDPLNALKSSADGFCEALAPQTQDEAKRILLELVRVDELLEAYRQPVPKSELLRAGKADTEDVLKLLADNDYVRIAEGDGDPIVEVKHESLIRNWPRLVGWIDEKRVLLRQRLALTQTAQRWDERGRPSEGLLTGWQLQEATQQSDLSELEREFVEASAAELDRTQREREAALQREAQAARELARRERRARIKVTYGLGIALLLLVINGVLFWNASRKQEALARRAEDMAQLAAAQRRSAQELAQTAEAQKAENDKLREQYEYLNRLFVKQVQQAVAPQSHLPSTQLVTVYIHISNEEQRPRAEAIQQELAKLGIKAPGVERVPARLQSTQVRYFRPADRLGAQEIKRLLSEYLAVGEIETPLIKGFETKVPGRQYEIWFGPEAFGGGYGVGGSTRPTTSIRR